MSAFLNNIEEEFEEEFEHILPSNQASYPRKTRVPPSRHVSSTATKARAPPQRAPRASKAPKANKNCQIHLLTYCQLFGFLLFGAGLALSHHFFYQNLNDQTVSDLTLGVPGFGGSNWGGLRIDRQQLYLQLGTLIAWIAQGCFAATINAAYNQYAWTIMRAWSSKSAGYGGGAVRVRTLECMFSGSSDLMAFLDPRFIRAAPISWFMAAFIWLMPLTGLFTQATLNVAQSVDAVSTSLAKGSTTVPKTSGTTKYAYKQKTLALSYGISFSFALFWALVGLICLVKNRGIGHGMRPFSSILATAWHNEIEQGMDQLEKAEQGMREDVGQHVSEGMESMFGLEGLNHQNHQNHQNQVGNEHARKGRKSNRPSRGSPILTTALKSEAEQGVAQLSKVGQDISEGVESIFGLEGWNHQDQLGNGNTRKGNKNNRSSPDSSMLATALKDEIEQGIAQLGKVEQDIRQDISEGVQSIFEVEDWNHYQDQVGTGPQKGRKDNQPSHDSSILATALKSEVEQGIAQLSKAEQDIRQDIPDNVESILGIEGLRHQVKTGNARKGRDSRQSRISSILTTTLESEVQQGMNQLSKAKQDIRQDISEGVNSILGIEGLSHQIKTGNASKGRNSLPLQNSSILRTTLESEVRQGMDQLSRAEQDIRQDISEGVESVLGIKGLSQQVKGENGRKGKNSLLSQNSSILTTTLESKARQGMNQLSRAEQDIRQNVSRNLENVFGVEGRNHQVRNVPGRRGRNNYQRPRNPSTLVTTMGSEAQQQMDQVSRVEQDIRQNGHQDVSEVVGSMFEGDVWDHEVENEHDRKGIQEQEVEESGSELD